MELNTSTKQSNSKGKAKTMAKILEEEDEEELEDEDEEADESSSSGCDCFFCIIKQPDARLRRASLAAFFRDLPYCEDDHTGQSCSAAVAAVWRAAMVAPDDPELPSLGAIRCMSLLLSRALTDEDWLRRGDNARVPYYAAHAIGSFTLRSPAHAELAVAAGAVRPLLALLGGAVTWVEQRAAARALGHLASYDATFPAIARHAAEAVPFAARAASACVADVYAGFVALLPARRPRYQRDLLLGRQPGPSDGCQQEEERKAEEWASQLQRWSLYLLSCLASRDASSHAMICQDAMFLRELSRMWGGLANGDSPAGVGLMRLLCRGDVGRGAVAACRDALASLCDLARSSDDWQYMAIDCLLLLLDDHNTWRAVADATASCLVDLVEVRQLGPRRRLGDAIARALLRDVDDIQGYDELGLEAKEAIVNMRNMKVKRKEAEEAMPGDELLKREMLAKEKRREGNDMFMNGNIDKAIELYTEALELCPLSRRSERLVLYSNRAQCRLARREADAAVSDATRALALARPANAHDRSLWRRAQAYDIKGMARESLLDCLAFAGAWLDRRRKRRPARGGVNPKLPYCVARMISKQMSLTGLFAGMANMNGDKQLGGDDAHRMLRCGEDDDDNDGDKEDDPDDGGSEEDLSVDGLKLCTSGTDLPIIEGDTWRRLIRRL